MASSDPPRWLPDGVGDDVSMEEAPTEKEFV